MAAKGFNWNGPQEDDEEDEKLLEELEDKQLLAREKCYKTFFYFIIAILMK